MKKQKIISTIIIVFMLFYFIFSIIPVGITRSFAADMAIGTLTSDINSIDDTLYPGYKNLINNLKAIRGNDTFLVYYTGIDWNQAINAEYQGHWNSPVNLVEVGPKYTGRWLCPLCGTKAYDNGSLCCASKEAIAYMMDPRNSINETDIFQFKDLEASDVSLQEIQVAVSKYGAFINNSEAIQAIYDASKTYRVNAYFIIAKIINEHGANGTTLSNGANYTIDGVTKKVYNYFNISSSGNGVDLIINNGLKVAYTKDWTSITASIHGGTAIIRQSYIDAYSQNTLYYQKFNVSRSIDAVGSHQYQQNLLAAQSQGSSLRNYYNGKKVTHTFIIPLYKNMPRAASPRPDANKVNTITYEEGEVRHVTKSLTVRVSPSKNSAAIGKLNNEESIKILNRATGPSADGYYWDLIVSNVDGTYGYAARYVGGDECIVSKGVSGSSSTINKGDSSEVDHLNKFLVNEVDIETLPSVNYEILKSTFKSAVVKDTKGNIITSGNIGTGYTASIDGRDFTLIKKGDIDGDADVSIFDLVYMLNYLTGKESITGVNLEAAKLENGAEVTIFDLVYMLNYLQGKSEIGF